MCFLDIYALVAGTMVIIKYYGKVVSLVGKLNF